MGPAAPNVSILASLRRQQHLTAAPRELQACDDFGPTLAVDLAPISHLLLSHISTLVSWVGASLGAPPWVRLTMVGPTVNI